VKCEKNGRIIITINDKNKNMWLKKRRDKTAVKYGDEKQSGSDDIL
jgi:hypothetical protein